MDKGKNEESEEEDVIDMNDKEETIMKEYFVQEAGSPARGQLSEKERRGSIGGKDESWLGEQIQQEEGHEEVVGGREAWKGGDNQEQGKGEDGVDLQVLLHQLARGGEDPEEGEVSRVEEKEREYKDCELKTVVSYNLYSLLLFLNFQTSWWAGGPAWPWPASRWGRWPWNDGGEKEERLGDIWRSVSCLCDVL